MAGATIRSLRAAPLVARLLRDPGEPSLQWATTLGDGPRVSDFGFDAFVACYDD